MNRLIKALVIAGALSAGSLAAATPASAYDHHRRSSVSVYVDTGNVSVGYRNGYYDHDRRWHRWRGDSHRNYYRRHHRSHYRDYYYRDHDRYRDRRHRRHRDYDRW